MKMRQCSETLALKIQTPVNNPEESIQQVNIALYVETVNKFSAESHPNWRDGEHRASIQITLKA
jgi:hypothetical protein